MLGIAARLTPAVGRAVHIRRIGAQFIGELICILGRNCIQEAVVHVLKGRCFRERRAEHQHQCRKEQGDDLFHGFFSSIVLGSWGNAAGYKHKKAARSFPRRFMKIGFFAYKATSKKAHLLRPSSLSCDVSLRLLTVSQSRCENDSEKFERWRSINKATKLPTRTRGAVPGSSTGFRHLTRPSV